MQAHHLSYINLKHFLYDVAYTAPPLCGRRYDRYQRSSP